MTRDFGFLGAGVANPGPTTTRETSEQTRSPELEDSAMPSLTRSELLLRTLCDLIEDPAAAQRIRAMDPDDPFTFAEAYCVVRHLRALTPELREALVTEIVERSDRETERLLRNRRDADGSSAQRERHARD